MDVLKFLLIVAECVGAYFIFSKILSVLATIINIPLSAISVYTGLIPWAFAFYYISVYLVKYAERVATNYEINELTFLIVVTVCIAITNLGGKVETENPVGVVFLKIVFPILSIATTFIMYSYKTAPIAQPVNVFLNIADYAYNIPFVGGAIHGGILLCGTFVLILYSFAIIFTIANFLKKK